MTGLLDLHEDVLVDIFAHLPVKSILKLEQGNRHLFSLLIRHANRLPSADLNIFLSLKSAPYTKFEVHFFASKQSMISLCSHLGMRVLNVDLDIRQLSIESLAAVCGRLFRRCKPMTARLSNIPQQDLEKVSQLFPSSVRELVFLGWLSDFMMIELLEHLPNVAFIDLKEYVSLTFLRHPACQRLTGVEFPWTANITEDIILSSQWSTFQGGQTSCISMTLRGLEELLQQWIENKRQLVQCRFVMTTGNIKDIQMAIAGVAEQFSRELSSIIEITRCDGLTLETHFGCKIKNANSLFIRVKPNDH